jgi:hypothetical protein
LAGEPHQEVKNVKTIKFKGKRRACRVAEWKDIKPIVERHLVEHKKFYEELAEL